MADSALPGLRVFASENGALPIEQVPVGTNQRYWSRRGIAEWLCAQLESGPPVLVGIDHGFSFPLRYFETHGLALNWPAFLDDFQAHWPTDSRNVRVKNVRRDWIGNGSARQGDSRWRRLTEIRVRAKSVFHFDIPGSVATSTHAGLPWLRWLRQRLPNRIHFWPFDGWTPAPGKSMIAEIYPSLWKHQYPIEHRTPDQHDAFVTAAWLHEASVGSHWQKILQPDLAPAEEKIARIEGWILGVA